MQLEPGARMDPPSDLIQSVSRALRILETVGTAPSGMNPKAVARRCELKLSTTYHLMRTLSYEGYLHRREDGDYVLGLEIADRFRDLAAALGRPPGADEVLSRIVRATEHSAYLARFVEGRVTIVSVIEGPQSPRLEDLIPGFDEAAHATALGKALLSTLEPPERHAYFAVNGLRRFTAATIINRDAFEDDLTRASSGLFSEVGQYRDGVACAAVLVHPPDAGEPWCALGLSAAPDDLAARADQLGAVLHRAAAALSESRKPAA